MTTPAQPFEFQRAPDGLLTLSEAVYQALGAASMCWENVRAAGVFDSTRAAAIGEALMDEIIAHVERAAVAAVDSAREGT